MKKRILVSVGLAGMPCDCHYSVDVAPKRGGAWSAEVFRGKRKVASYVIAPLAYEIELGIVDEVYIARSAAEEAAAEGK